jgi:hypothetical protein
MKAGNVMTVQGTPANGTAPILATPPARSRIRFAAAVAAIAAGGVAALAMALSLALPTLASASTHAAASQTRCTSISSTSGHSAQASHPAIPKCAHAPHGQAVAAL